MADSALFRAGTIGAVLAAGRPLSSLGAWLACTRLVMLPLTASVLSHGT